MAAPPPPLLASKPLHVQKALLNDAPRLKASFPSRSRAASEERGRRPAALRSQEFSLFASCCILLSHTRRVLMAKPLGSPPTSVCCQSFIFIFYGFCLSTEPPADLTSRRLRAAINPRSSQEFLPPRWLDMCRAVLLTEVPPSLFVFFVPPAFTLVSAQLTEFANALRCLSPPLGRNSECTAGRKR